MTIAAAFVEEEPKVLFVPRPHQREAIEEILRCLSSGDRCQIRMACGTGKTLIGAWAAIALPIERCLVLVPSLALIRQSVAEWKQTGANFRWIAICSDPPFDENEDRPGKDYNTDSGAIESFFDGHRASDLSVVYATYQSLHLVEAARQTFDLIICDEAHRTAGENLKRFSKALTVESKSRLFMTATPRNSSMVDDTGMDNERLYGPVAFNMTFQQAVAREIIVPFMPLVCAVKASSGLTERDTANASLAHVAVKAIKDAHSNYHVRHVISFHNNVLSARHFANTIELPGFLKTHINCYMKPIDRREAVENFVHAPKALISNVRCLVEGIDIPEVDAVIFLSPKDSPVDIVQAVGRAMRKVPGKEMGYVIIPVLVHDEEVEEGAEHFGFSTLLSVIKALSDIDETIATAVSRAKEDYTQTGKADLRDVFGFLGDTDIDVNAFMARCIESMRRVFDVRVVELAEFIKHKKRQPSTARREDMTEVSLALWVKKQRRAYRAGELQRDKVNRLLEAGLSFDPLGDKVEEMVDKLRAFRQQNGGSLKGLKITSPEWKWIESKKFLHKRGVLDPELQQRLEELGVMWRKKRDTPGRLATLRLYLKNRAKAPNYEMETIIRSYRSDAHRMSPKLMAALNKMNFPWEEKSPRKRGQNIRFDPSIPVQQRRKLYEERKKKRGKADDDYEKRKRAGREQLKEEEDTKDTTTKPPKEKWKKRKAK